MEEEGIWRERRKVDLARAFWWRRVWRRASLREKRERPWRSVWWEEGVGGEGWRGLGGRFEE